jgi:hypothetical protein
MNTRVMAILAVAAVGTLSAAAPAQARIRDLHDTQRGTGELTWRGGRDRIDSATVSLRANGRAEVRLQGRERHTFAGTWRETRAGLVSLRLEGNFGRAEARADGTVSLRGNQFDRIVLGGQAAGGSLSVRFDARDDWRGGGGGAPWNGGRPSNPTSNDRGPWGGRDNDRWDDRRYDDWYGRRYNGRRFDGTLGVTQGGQGSVVIGGRRIDDLVRVSVDLRRDGSAQIRFEGRRDRHTFGGRWTPEGRDSENIRVVLEGDFRGDRARLDGIVNLRLRSGSERIDRIDIGGWSDNRRVSVRFDAR